MEPDEYDRMAIAEESHWWYRSTRALLDQILFPFIDSDAVVLDAGCGTGSTGAWIATRTTLIGLDAERHALDLFAQSHPLVPLVAGNVMQLPWRDSSFDAAVCVTVLHHRSIAEPASAVAELVRVVRPGGLLCLLEPGIPRLFRAHDRMVHGARRFSPAQLSSLLEHQKCHVLRSSGAYSFLVPAAAVKAVTERHRSASDLNGQRGLVGKVLLRMALIERRWLLHHDVPIGLSVWALATKQR